MLLVSMVCLLFLLLLTVTACNSDSRLSQQGEIVRDQNGFTSSTSSNMVSDQYPHTKALLEQPARYESYVVEMQEQHSNGFPIPLPIDIEFPIPGLQPGDDQQQPRMPNPTQGETQPQQPAAPNQSADANTIAVETRVIELTNVERRNNGLADLQADSSLSGVAREKSHDMQKNNYFSHTSPTYGSPFDMMRDMGISFMAAGENIAMGQQTPEQVVEAWMNSEGHRRNILREDYTHIGVGYIPDGSYWTQMFIRK